MEKQTLLFKNLSEKTETTFFDIFDIIYCHFVKKYDCGILSYKIDNSIIPNVIALSFYGDGLLECKFITNDPVEQIGNKYAILYWEGVKYKFGQEKIFTLNEIKELVFKGTTNKFKKLKIEAK
jgi:hypothetical protein